MSLSSVCEHLSHIHWLIERSSLVCVCQPCSLAFATSSAYACFFLSKTSSITSSNGIVNSINETMCSHSEYYTMYGFIAVTTTYCGTGSYLPTSASSLQSCTIPHLSVLWTCLVSTFLPLSHITNSTAPVVNWPRVNLILFILSQGEVTLGQAHFTTRQNMFKMNTHTQLAASVFFTHPLTSGSAEIGGHHK